jgi:hypothetical protein
MMFSHPHPVEEEYLKVQSNQPVNPVDGEPLHDQAVHPADGEPLHDQPNPFPPVVRVKLITPEMRANHK